MKLILSTLALGTAAAAPMMQESSADAPKGEPLKAQVGRSDGAARPTAKPAPRGWKVVMAPSAESPQDDDQKELENAAKELENELARLRAELQVMRDDLAREREEAVRERGSERRAVVREKAEKGRAMTRARRAEALEAAKAAHQEARNARDAALAEAKDVRQQARELVEGATGRHIVRLEGSQETPRGKFRFFSSDDSPEDGDAEAIIKFIDDGDGEAQVFVLKDGEALPSKAPEDIKRRWAAAKVKVDARAPRAPVELRWAVKGIAKDEDSAPRWRFESDGDQPKGLAWITDVEVETDEHGEHGEHGEHESHDHDHGEHHDTGDSNINIHVEHGDVHIHAGGSSIHTSGGHGKSPKPHGIGLLGKVLGGDKKGAPGLFGMDAQHGKNGPGLFGGKAIRKVIVNGKEVDSSSIDMPDGFFFGSDDDESNFSFGFSGEIDLEDIGEGLGEALEGLGDIEGLSVIEGLSGIAGLRGHLDLEGLEGLTGGNARVRIMHLDHDSNDWLEEAREKVGAIESAEMNIEVKTINENGETETRVFVNGEEIENFLEAEECEEEECEEDEDDDRFVWLRGPGTPVAPSAPRAPGQAAGPAAPSSPFPAPVDGVRLAVRPGFPGALAPPSPRGAADQELAKLAREIREELRAMRAEIRELRAEVMRAPLAPGRDPVRAQGQRRQGRRR